MNSSRSAIVAMLLATVALTGCPRPRKQCLAGQDYFADFDDCLWRCNDPATPPGERCVESDGGVREGGVGRSDASDVVSDMTTAPVDSGSDAGSGEVATDGDASEGIAAPRQVFPLSLVMLSGNQPTLKWALATGTDGASIELCRDRALTAECQRWTATGSESRVPMALARGPWFWRLRGRSETREGTATSATWYFWSSGRASARDATYAQIPDVNGDGLADVVWVENDARNPMTLDGGSPLPSRVIVQLGRRGQTPSAVVDLPVPRARFILNAVLADVNGDGFGDLVATDGPSPAGSSTATGTRIFVLAGSPGGLATTQWIEAPDVRPSGFGFIITAVGDTNGDGRIELAICSPIVELSTVSTTGRCHLYSGIDTGLSLRPEMTISAPSIGPGSTFNPVTAPRALGDINADGFADLVVGSEQYLRAGERAATERLYVYLGSRAGLPATPSQTLLAPSERSLFGIQFAILGDQDGDGFLELACAAPTGSPRGAVFVFTSDAAGIRTPAIQSFDDTLSTGEFRGGRPVGDINGDGRGDLAMSLFRDNFGTPRVITVQSSIHVGSAGGVESVGQPWFMIGADGIRLPADEIAGLGDIDGDGFSDVLDFARAQICFGRNMGVPDRCTPSRPRVEFSGLVSALF